MDSYMDQCRTGPETLAGRYMRLFWHPVYRSEDLKAGWAKPIKIMSENFTLYRGEAARRTSSLFNEPTAGSNFPSVGLRTTAFAAAIMAGSMTPPANASKCRRSPNQRPKPCAFEAIRRLSIWDLSSLISAPENRLRHRASRIFENGKATWTESYARPCNFFYNLETDPVHIPFVHRESEFYYNQPIEVPTRSA